MLTMKNKETGKAESITQIEITKLDWGFHFFTETEIDAYKAAYLYRDSKNGVKVEYAGGTKKWMVTVFNAQAAEIGLTGSK